MLKKRKEPWDLSNLPENWTMDDIEKRMPPELRRRKQLFRLTFKQYPYVGHYDPTFVAEFFASLNYDEKDALKAKFKQLQDEKIVMEFNLQAVTTCKSDFFDSVIKAIRKIHEPKVTHCSWCSVPSHPDPIHHPDGQVEHDLKPVKK